MADLKHIQIARRFQRAIRIDTDIDDADSLAGYVPVQSLCDALLRMGEQIASSKQRAFTWTGPYGGGKSSLALVLASALSPNPSARRRVAAAIGLSRLAKIQSRFSLRSKGWLIIPVVGQRADIVKAIGIALERAARTRWGKKIPKALSVAKFHSTPSDLIAQLQIATSICGKEGGGLLLIVDEMGKFLEHAAHTSGDIYFLQELAEMSSRLEARLVIVGILHQAFEQYALRLRRDARDEWAKIQGRFVDVPLATASDEIIELIGKALVGAKSPKSHFRVAEAIARSIRSRRPGVSSELAARLNVCWPLHPAVAGLLASISRRRFGQNERSTFGFLNSGEPGGFQEFLRSADPAGSQTYEPSNLWDYLRLNLESAILASADAHRWAEAVEAVERAQARGSPLHANIAKTVAMLDLFGASAGLAADDLVLRTCCEFNAKKLDEALNDLRRWSIIVHRKHLKAWALFAGSDFDIDAAITQMRGAQVELDFTRLQSIANQQPILAKRHYYERGTLRWFETRICPLNVAAAEIAQFQPVNGVAGLFLLLLPTERENAVSAQKICTQLASTTPSYPLVIGLARNSELIHELLSELCTLEKVRTTETELEGDAVARRELAGRISAISYQLDSHLKEAIGTATWFVNGRKVGSIGITGINRFASDLADKTYSKAPILKNELINRVKPSSNAIAAQRVLMHRIVTHSTYPNLGLEGFPPERGLYAAVLFASGIHKKDKQNRGQFKFGRPQGQKNSGTYLELWKEAERFLRATESQRAPLSELYKIWSEPPFGLRLGIIPILSLAFLIANEGEIAVYLDGHFYPRLDEFFVDRLLQDPNEILVRRFEIASVRRVTLEHLAKIIQSTEKVDLPIGALAISKSLVGFARNLHPWVRRTSSLSPTSTRVRDALLKADDPLHLVFEQLPEACGVPHITDETRNKGIAEDLCTSLVNALDELRSAFPIMLDRLRKRIFDTLGERDGSKESIFRISERAGSVIGITGDFRLEAFANRLKSLNDSIEWIEGIAGLAANKPARDWTDGDYDRATLELIDLSSRFRRAETLAQALGRPAGAQSFALVVGTGAETEALIRTFNVTSEEQARIADLVQQLRKAFQERGMDNDLALAVLAEIGRQIIVESKSTGAESKKPDMKSVDEFEGRKLWRH